jgi:hypothetical protein
MHDVLAHKVSLIALHAGGLEVNPAVGPEKVESSAGLHFAADLRTDRQRVARERLTALTER